MGELLTKDAILAAQDIPYEDVEVPEWGGVVRIRGLSAKDRDELGLTFDANDKESVLGLRGRLLQKVIVGDDGNLLFTPEQLDEIVGKAASVIDKLFNVAQRLSGFSKSEVAAITENLSEGQSAGSNSD